MEKHNMYMDSANGGMGTDSVLAGGQTYAVGSMEIITGFDPSKDVFDLGTDSIHNQIGVDTADGFAMIHMFDSSKSTLLEGVYLKDLTAGNFAPIADAHLQQDLSASLAFENGTGLVRENTVYVRSHEAGLVETVDFNPATDKISMFYLSVRGDQGLNFVAEDTAEGARFYSPITGQSLTLRNVSMSELTSDHFEWRANQIEDNVAGRMGLTDQIDGFTYENIYSGKSVPMAGLVDRAPYHSQPDYTGTPIGQGNGNDSGGGDMGGGDNGGDTGDGDAGAPINVTVTGGSVTEGDPGMPHMHGDGTSHVHDDGHKYIVFSVSLDAPATSAISLNYTTADGLAVADTTNSTAWDYHETKGTLVFAPGEQTKSVPVAVHPDTLVELTETFTFQISGDNITGDLVATGIIFDNDTADSGGGDMGGGDMGDGASAVAFDTSNQWDGGFVAAGTFTPDAATNGWTITFTSTAEITNIWNAEIVSKEGNVYTIQNVDYNASVAAGQEISFGFQAAGNDATIADVTVNGEAVDTGGDMGGGDMGGDTGGDMGGDTGGGYDGGGDTGGGNTGGGNTGGGNTGGVTVGGGQTYAVGSTDVITGFDPSKDVFDLGTDSIHNQIGVDTADGFAMIHMFDSSKSTLLEGVYLKDLTAGNFAPIADAHLQQDLSASLAFENGTGLVRENTVYVRSHEAGLVETVDFNPATDKISMFYLSVRGDQGLNFVAEDTAEGARFYSPITGQSLTLRNVSMSELTSDHFEWRANQIEDNVAGRMGLTDQIDGFTYENIYSGKSVPMAGLVDRAPYHSQPDYTGTPIGQGNGNDSGGGDMGGGDNGGDTGDGDAGAPINVTVTGGSVTEGDPGMPHMHGDGTSHVHDDGHKYIVFSVSLDAPASEEVTLTYATADGTAVADTTNITAWDYHEASGTLVFAPGEQTKTVTVAVHPDTLVEGDETFTLTVAGDNITGSLTATGTIIDNDTADTGGDGGMDGGGDMGGGDMGGSSDTVAFDTSNQWNGGFVAEATFTPDAATNGWTITFTSTAEITNIWNAEIVSKDGDVYTVKNASYNADVAAGQEISFGFQAAGNDATISGVTVNGQPVDTGGDTGGDTGSDTGGDTGGDAGGDTGGDAGGGNTGGDTGGGNTGGGNTPGGGDVLNGPLSTVGTDIVDADGLKVDLKGVNWFGFETDISMLHGLWARNMEEMLDDIEAFGFNMIRLPFAGELALTDATPTGINTGENPALAGMSSLDVMAEFLDAAAERGIGVLLDMHRQTPGNGPEGGGRLVDVDAFMAQWAAMAEKFGDHPAVIGFDLLNEPHGYSWDEWAPIAEQVGNMLLESNPDELIIVEGVETYQGESHWWGGNLKGVADRPIELNADNKLVYSPHEYATSVFEQPYFTEAGYDAETTLPQIFSENWGFIEEQGIAPVLLGEFGSKFENQTDKDWGPVLAEYLLENDIDWAMWSWNPNSGDTGGVVKDDWETPREEAFTYLLDMLLGEGNEAMPAQRVVFDPMADPAADIMNDMLMVPEDMMGF
ncbi:cellulase family glycosylhydrolase [Cognatiyoonia sp. IB215446]|uniref:cellulase family glycosylhydrolase n=1 Tax=Cognatiyoonia sp. IB215446 TaxID=3097355 RepID=UPI002A161967|nr:cellulase family glycosylhydrolase [Cognatiyoonia sp. IB215446]MDX8348940.1 cellulase family glycosylhydrolase [Cognatiyoonia sp. IB215446]